MAFVRWLLVLGNCANVNIRKFIGCPCSSRPISSNGKLGETLFDLLREIAEQMDDAASCKCLRTLRISSHGNPSGLWMRGRKGEETWDTVPPANHSQYMDQATVLGSNNADSFGKIMKKIFCFCKPCTIILQGCNVGLDGQGGVSNLGSALAAATGCTVRTPNGYVSVNPGSDKVSGAWAPYGPYPGSSDTWSDYPPPTPSASTQGSSGGGTSDTSNKGPQNGIKTPK